MPKKPSRWGHPGSSSIMEEDGWFIGLRAFTFTDAEGGTAWQFKTARDMWHFRDPNASSYGWKSRVSSRHRTDFATQEQALAAARAYVTQHAAAVEDPAPRVS
jgi:hypothetical protein